MAKSKKKPLRKDKDVGRPEKIKKEPERIEEDEFDFGGIPKDVDLKKNMGCGG